MANLKKIEQLQAKVIIDEMIGSIDPVSLKSGLRRLMDVYFLSPDTEDIIDPVTKIPEKEKIYDCFSVLSQMITRVEAAATAIGG